MNEGKPTDLSGVLDTLVLTAGDWLLAQLKINQVPGWNWKSRSGLSVAVGTALVFRIASLARTLAQQYGVPEDTIVLTLLSAAAAQYKDGKAGGYHSPTDMHHFVDQFYTKAAEAEIRRTKVDKIKAS